MSVTPLNDLRNSVSSHQLSDEKMQQVKKILFSDYERHIEDRVNVLEDRIKNLELSLHGRLDALQARLDAISAKTQASQAQALNEIGSGLQELAERLKPEVSGHTENENHDELNKTY